MQFEIVDQKDWVLIKLIKEGILSPKLLSNLDAPNLVNLGYSGKGVVLFGAAPIWVYAFLTHWYHPASFVATYDTHIGMAVVVATHSVNFACGDLIDISEVLKIS